MAPSITGSLVQVNSAVNSSSTAITVPSAATGVLLSAGGWNTPEILTFAVMTLGGVNMRLIRPQVDIGAHEQAVYWLPRPATGSQTFAWDLTGATAPTDGYIYHFAFIKDNDLSPGGENAFRDIDGTFGTGTVFTLPTLSAMTGDLVVCLASMFISGGDTFTWSGGVTKIADSTGFAGTINSMAQASPSGNITPVCTMSPSTDGSVVGVVIKSPTTIPIDYSAFPKYLQAGRNTV